MLRCHIVCARVWLYCLALPASGVSQSKRLLGEAPLPVVSVDTVGVKHQLGVVIAGAVGEDGSVLVVDKTVSTVFRLSASDSLVTTYGKAGDGPGEFRLPYRVAERPDGHVVVYDLGSLSFSEFERNGRFLRRWVPSVPIIAIDNMVALPRNELAITGVIRDARGGKNAIHVFDAQFRLLRSFGELPSAKARATLDIWGAGSLTLASQGRLLFSRRIPYEVSWYDVNGARYRTVKLPGVKSRVVEDVFTSTASASRVQTRINTDASYPLAALELPDGTTLSGRKVGSSVIWDLISETGRAMWSGRPPDAVRMVLGVDRKRGAIWMLGERGDGEPALWHVNVAGRPR